MGASLGLYRRYAYPWGNDWVFRRHPEMLSLRSEVLAPATGCTLEIGFGTGLNLAHYPGTVRELVAVEPNPGMLKRAASRLADARFPVEICDKAAECIPFDDESFDTVVSVFTLCTVEDPVQSLAELRRVLRDGGRLLVLEHGLAQDETVAKWQRRLDRLHAAVGCGCHLVRHVDSLLHQAGFALHTSRRFFAPNVSRLEGWTTIGAARKVERVVSAANLSGE